MKDLRSISLICTVVLLLFSCSRPEVRQGRINQPSDTLYTEMAAMEIYGTDPERALLIIDSAEIVGNMDAFRASLARATVYGCNESSRSRGIAICKQLLDKRDLSLEDQADVLGRLNCFCRMRQDNAAELEYGPRYIEICRRLGDDTKALGAQSELGSTLIRLGRVEEGLESIDNAIKQLEGMHKFEGLEAGIRAQNSKIRTLDGLGRYDEIIPAAGQILRDLEDFERRPEEYADGSPFLPTDLTRPAYIDYYRAHAYAYLAYGYAKTGQTLEAKEYVALFDSTRYSKCLDGKKMIASTLALLGDYRRMLSLYEELEKEWGADTLHHDYSVMWKNRADAARSQGNMAGCVACLNRYINLQNILNDREKQAVVQEIAARYHEDEQELALAREKANSRRKGFLAAALGFVILLIGAFSFIVVRQLISIRDKNIALASEISESLEYKEMYLNAAEKPQTADVSAMDDVQLYEHLRYVILEQGLYLDPRFDRQQLVDRLHLSKERIGAAFSHGSRYRSLSAFLNDVRLQHGAKLLADCPDMHVIEIASASGFSSSSLFARNFKQKYALTPSEFRAKKKKQNKTEGN